MALLTGPFANLTRVEAEERANALRVAGYEIDLDLSLSEETFASRTVITFASERTHTFLDLKALVVERIELDGQRLDPAAADRGRYPLDLSAGEHRLEVEATMAFRNDGEGLHRSTDPADGRQYVYGMSFMDAAPSVFACFDQPDLKGTISLSVTAPPEWSVVANGPGREVEAGRWEFDRTPPLSTYFVTLVAGPWHLVHSSHDGIPLSLSARASLAEALDRDADELFTMTGQCFDEFHRLFGIRYPFGNYHQAFVPEFNAGAMENPGCVTFRDPLIFDSDVPRSQRLSRATTVAHEMAHQWFGNIVTPRWWDDLWLNESFAEYMGNRVTADVTEFSEAWVHDAYSRRQWGLRTDARRSTHPVAGNGAADAASALQDFDGISYNKGAAILRQLNALLGDEAFFAGAIDHFTAHRFGNATMLDLFGAWERAAGRDLSAFTDRWLRTAGVDVITLDRVAGQVRVTPPSAGSGREHSLPVWHSTQPGHWQTTQVTELSEAAPCEVPNGAVVLVDPLMTSWAAVPVDAESLKGLAAVLVAESNDLVRAGAWSSVQSAYDATLADPDLVIDVMSQAFAAETVSSAFAYVVPWAMGDVVPLTSDPARARHALHTMCLQRAASAEPGSSLALSATRGAISACDDPDLLRTWLAEPPGGTEADVDLRWRILVRLACLGAVSEDELSSAYAADPVATAHLGQLKARAALPTPEAKELAWSAFLGETEASNYELEALGRGMWAAGLTPHTEPYLDRYFAEIASTAAVRSGWVLASSAQDFYPHTVIDARVDALATEAIAGITDPGLRRAVSDCQDDTRTLVRVASRWR